MPTLQDILDDSKTFEDGIELEIKGHKVSLADLRGLSKSQQDKLSRQLSEADNKQKQAASDAEKAAKILNDLTELQGKAASEAEKAAAAATAGEDDFDTNNWWTPVRKRLTPLESAIKELKDTVKANNDAIARAAAIWAEDRWHGQYDRGSDRLRKSAKHKDMTYEQVRDYATAQKMLDSYGFPSIDKAISELTKEDEMDRIRREAKEEGIKEGQQRARLQSTPRPTSASGARKAEGKGLDPSKNFEDLGDAIAEDAELMEMLSQVQGLSPDDIVQ